MGLDKSNHSNSKLKDMQPMLNDMTVPQIEKLIAEHVIEKITEGATELYASALIGDSDIETLEDAVRELVRKRQ